MFDLDGTISDSAPGILGSLELAFADHDLPWIGPDAARAILGPPFRTSLVPYMPASLIEPVIVSYRRYYNDLEGMYNTTLYDGIEAVLTALHDDGFALALATSKPEEPAIAIAKYLKISHYFATIAGDTHDGVLGTKALVVGEALTRLGRTTDRHHDVMSPGDRHHDVIMIGDRHHDVDGATQHGVRCIGAQWGYGGADELAAAGAHVLVEHPHQLLDAIRSALPSHQ